MQMILAKRQFLFAALLVLLLSFSLAACNSETNGNNGAGGDGNATLNGDNRADAAPEGDSDEEPFEIQEVPGTNDGTTSELDADATTQAADAASGASGADATAQPAAETGQDGDAQAAADCFETDPHPIGEAIAEDLDADYEQVMGWFCEGSSFEDILLALQTSELTGRPAEDILDEIGSRSWLLIWQEEGLMANGAHGDTGTGDALSAEDGDAQDSAGDAQGSGASDSEAQLTFEDDAIEWTGDEFQLTGTVVGKDEMIRAIDVEARNEEGRDQVYAFDVGDNDVFDQVEEGDRVLVTGERLDDGSVVAYEMRPLPAQAGGDAQDGDELSGLEDRFSSLAPGEFEFRGTIVSLDADERSFELELARPAVAIDLWQDDTGLGGTESVTSTSPSTGTNGLEPSGTMTGTNGLDVSGGVTGATRVGEEQSLTFYVPDSLSFGAFGLGDVIEVEVEPLGDLGFGGDLDATDSMTTGQSITGTDGTTGTDTITGTDTVTGTDGTGDTGSTGDSGQAAQPGSGDDSDQEGDAPSLSGSTGDGDNGSTQGAEDDLNGRPAADTWGMVEFEQIGTVQAVDETAGSIDVLVRSAAGWEETYTFRVPSAAMSHYEVGGGVQIEVQLEATAAEMGQGDALNGDLGDASGAADDGDSDTGSDSGIGTGDDSDATGDDDSDTGNDDADDDADTGDDDADDDADTGSTGDADDAEDTGTTGALFGQGPVGLGAGEIEFRGTVVAVNEADGSIDLRLEPGTAGAPDRAGTAETSTGTDLGSSDDITGTQDITGTDLGGSDEITGTQDITGTGSTGDSDSMADADSALGDAHVYTFFLPEGRSLAGFAEGYVVEIEIEPALMGGVFELDDATDDRQAEDSDEQGYVDPTGEDDDAGTDVDDEEGDATAGSDQDSLGLLPRDPLAAASFRVLGEVVAVDEDAGTIDVRVVRAAGLSEPGSDLAATGGMTATNAITGTDTVTGTDTTSTGDDQDDSDTPGTGASQATGDEIYTFPIADARAWQYYVIGTLVEIEFDVEQDAATGLDGLDGDAVPSDAQAAGQVCAAGAADQHPLLQAISGTYAADDDQIRDWYCEDNLGFGEIMLALTTARLSGDEVDEIVTRRVEDESWGEIWQQMGLIGRPEDAGQMNDSLNDD